MGVVEFAAKQPITAIEKARLITEALDALRTAQPLDERDSLDDFDSTGWVAWYDATIPQVRDIKILAGAMEIEMLRRRGEARRKPGPKTGVELLTHRDSNSDQQQRSRARALDAQPERIATYIQHEAAAGRVPSVRGAVRAVKTTLSMTDPKTSRFRSGQEIARRSVADCIGALDAVADGERRTDEQLLPTVGDVTIFLQRVRLLPWLSIDRTAAGTVFIIDHDLRAICDGRAPRPAIGKSIRAYLLDLRAEITRRRRENHDDFRKRKWNHEGILKREQSALLDWIEEQLNKVPN